MIVIGTCGGFVMFAIDAACVAVFARRRMRCQPRVIRRIDAAREREGCAPPEGLALSGHARGRGRFPR
ncbi:hypothetical protein G3N96_26645 [Burkholderia sp. Se-20373]|uniref:hypothetical protein n=1 Tax=Burkholderia sp. Se-20373 TaxID=2703898 RepID=UPI00197FD4F5|nr:hypothetical protein [Burkholderia sp. Se-20373]MBN3748979.1 hypothetical protein [Burkholderia sp. Se-20373]